MFIDCKIGDIDNTMNAYIKLLFNDLNSDGIVVNPYMGDDVFIPFIEDKQKVAIVLIQTSNIAAKAIQELRLESGKMLWEELLNLMLKRWNVNNNLIPILSSNCDINNYKIIREKLPNNMPILLAGIGAQGGNYNIMQQILNDERSGVFVNSSRGILYPYYVKDINWRTKVSNAVVELRNKLNFTRYAK